MNFEKSACCFLNSSCRSEHSAPLELAPTTSRRYFLGREGFCSALGTSNNILNLIIRAAQWILRSFLATHHCQCLYKGVVSLKGSRRMGNADKKRWKNLIAALFNEDLFLTRYISNEQYLQLVQPKFRPVGPNPMGQWPNPIDQITKKTPNPKYRLYWC